jgi:hypothetical protein
MKRLTTNDTNHILALLNLFYAEDNEVMVRGGDPEPDYADTTLVELIRRIANTHNLTIAAEDAESLGDEMYDAMFDGVDTVEGVVGLLHAAAMQAAEMRGRLEMIEDILGGDYNLDRLRELVEADRDGRLVMLDEPRKPLIWGDDNHDSILCPNCKHDLMGGFQEADSCEVPMYQYPYCGQPIDGTQALTHEEAETALKGENHEANPV